MKDHHLAMAIGTAIVRPPKKKQQFAEIHEAQKQRKQNQDTRPITSHRFPQQCCTADTHIENITVSIHLRQVAIQRTEKRIINISVNSNRKHVRGLIQQKMNQE